MIWLVSLYWSSFIHQHPNAQNESLFSTRNHFRFWICSNLMGEAGLCALIKDPAPKLRLVLLLLFALVMFLNSSLMRKQNSSWGKKKKKTRSKLCFWILRLGFRKHSANEMWPETRWGWQEVTLNVRNNSSSLALGSHVLIHGIKPKQSNTGTSELFTTSNDGFLVPCKLGKWKAFLSRPFCTQYHSKDGCAAVRTHKDSFRKWDWRIRGLEWGFTTRLYTCEILCCCRQLFFGPAK